jgi:hypothetical protein
VRVTMLAKTKEGKTLYHRSTTKAEGTQKEIYTTFGYISSFTEKPFIRIPYRILQARISQIQDMP